MEKPDTLLLKLSITGALLLAWAGIWGAWIPHATASMSQNAIDLAAWSAYLIDVRAGDLAHVPDLLRLALALGVVALAISAGSIKNVWLRWGLRLVAVLPGLVLLPPYPYVLQLWRSEVYGTRFLFSMVLWGGVLASGLLDLLSERVRGLGVIAFAVGSAVLGVWAFIQLRPPFEAHHNGPISPGWGVIVFALGLLLGAGLQAAVLFKQHRLSRA